MEMEISYLTYTVSVYMVHLQGTSHGFEINVINAFYNEF